MKSFELARAALEIQVLFLLAFVPSSIRDCIPFLFIQGHYQKFLTETGSSFCQCLNLFREFKEEKKIAKLLQRKKYSNSLQKMK